MILAKHETQLVHYKSLAQAYRAGNIVGISYHFGALRFLVGAEKASRIANLLKSVNIDAQINDLVEAVPNGYAAFARKTTSKFGTMRLWRAIQRNKKTVAKRIRKQDEAPQAGADSSPVLQCQDEAPNAGAGSC